MYKPEIGKKIEHLCRLVRRAKTEETREKHLAEIERLRKELFGK